MVVNAVLPVLWLHAAQSEDTGRSEKVWHLYDRYPRLAQNSLTRFFGRRVLPTRISREIMNTAKRQQGALQLYKSYCDTRRCEECAFLS